MWSDHPRHGKAIKASLAHIHEVRDGKIASMIQYVDSHMVMRARFELKQHIVSYLARPVDRARSAGMITALHVTN
ncbi:hypothetical protein A4U53_039895 (plasmid) [Rhizobium ruizarguesonis]|uniref:Uncharacterized protein n=1 Tax=Rhizobium ruizarguesonis TaxID=2081791 RepID=A0ACD5EX41_9HYPH